MNYDIDDDDFCQDCHEYVKPVIEDNSFDHAFGRENVFDYHCPHCDAHLYTLKTRPRPEFEEPEKDWMDYL